MIEIKDLLFNFDKLLAKEEVKKSIICEVFNKIINLNITPKDVVIKNNVIYLNIKPVFKNEIYLKKDLLNKRLKEELGTRAPKDIR